MKKKIPMLFFPGLLLLVGIFISYQNYSPGTFLLGWDSLHSEFNFSLAFQRALSGAWRGEQGLGALAAHSHMADLPRIVFLWLESFVLPQSFLRYSYIFLCLILGPLGVYFFVNHVINKKKTFSGYFSSFCAAFFYLFNLVTLQHFLVPFEMFPAQFAFAPFVFLFALRYIESSRRRELVLLALLVILLSPSAYAATLYYAFLLTFFLFLGGYWLVSIKKRVALKRLLVVFSLTLVLNLYWLLPNIYSVVNQSEMVSLSKINSLFSPEAFLRNAAYGDISNIATGKNFLFDWRNFDFSEDTFVDLMGVWDRHLGDWGVANISYTIFGLSILGTIIALVRRDKVGVSFFPVGLVLLFFLININPPTGTIYQYLINKLPVFGEALRMPFTKFSILFEFCLAFYLGYFLNSLPGVIKKFKIGQVANVLVGIFVIAGSVYVMLPVFRAELISSVVKTNLPTEYLQLFKWFEGKEGRVVRLPVNTLWGWSYNTWKYEGSGFLSYGLENPLLDRDYDRWSPYNETFYNEISSVVYKYQLPEASDTENEEKKENEKTVTVDNQQVISEFEKILQKYQVEYLLLDESVVNAGGGNGLLFIPEIKDLVAHSSNIKQVVTYGHLTVYSFVGPERSVSPVWTPETLVSVYTNPTYSKYDSIYQKYGNYITEKGGISIPFINYDARGDVRISVSEDQLTFKNEGERAKVILPVTDKIAETFSASQGYEEGYNCDLKKNGEVIKERLENGNFYGAYNGGVSCDWFYYPSVRSDQAYVLHLKGKNITGRSLKFYLQNIKSKRMDLEELLVANSSDGTFDSCYVIYPTKENPMEELGYTLNLETRSFGKIASENEIQAIEFIPFDIDFLASLTITGKEPQIIYNQVKVTDTDSWGTVVYRAKIEKTYKGKTGLVVLGQGYDNGWVAYAGASQDKNSKKLVHIKVNGWANGWTVPEGVDSSSTVTIFYWPQLLGWGGFILIIPALLMILWRKR